MPNIIWPTPFWACSVFSFSLIIVSQGHLALDWYVCAMSSEYVLTVILNQIECAELPNKIIVITIRAKKETSLKMVMKVAA